MTPDRAVGNTTRQVVRHSGEPSASDASRRPSGNEPKHDLGRARHGRQHQHGEGERAANPENPWPRYTIIAKMNRPATIDGIPLIASTNIRTGRWSRRRISFR